MSSDRKNTFGVSHVPQHTHITARWVRTTPTTSSKINNISLIEQQTELYASHTVADLT